MTGTNTRVHARPWVALVLLPVWLGAAAPFQAGSPSDADRARAIQIHKEAVERLRDGAKAAGSGDAIGFARALAEAARRIEALIETATWLPASERDALRRTAAGLDARAEGRTAGVLAGRGPGRARSRGLPAAWGRERGARVRGQLRPEPAGLGRGAGLRRPRDGHGAATGGRARRRPARIVTTRCASTRCEASSPRATYGGGPSKWHLVESGGNGVALLDYDGDGRLDVYTVSAFDLDERNGRARVPHRERPLPQPGRDEVRERGRRRPAWTPRPGATACAPATTTATGGSTSTSPTTAPTSCTGTRATARSRRWRRKAGVAADGWSTGCAFLDADGDGDLDLYVARYVTAPWEEVAAPGRFLMWRGVAKVMLGPAGLPGAADLFFENQGDGTFEEATETFGLTDATKAYGFGVVATDYDGDGWTDIFVANDSNPNFLYRNRGGHGFESVGLDGRAWR